MQRATQKKNKLHYKWTIAAILFAACSVFNVNNSPAGEGGHVQPIKEQVGGSLIYDYDPDTRVGDKVFGDIVSNLEKDQPGRNSHGGPVCLEYANGDIAAFCSSASGHNTDGWSEYALSKDGGKSWTMYHKFPYSFKAYRRDKSQIWVEAGLVTPNGNAVLFINHFKGGKRAVTGFMVSADHGTSWNAFQKMPDDYVGYPCATAVGESTSYVLFDGTADRQHRLFASTDNGKTWQDRGRLPLAPAVWYGALCLMEDGRLLAGGYLTKKEDVFTYCISKDGGRTWSDSKTAPLAKKIRDPELAYLDGRYYLHGRSGNSGKRSRAFVLYQSKDGETWDEGVYINTNYQHPDGYSDNCIIHKYDKDKPEELMVLYSICYKQRLTNEYVFFVRPRGEDNSQPNKPNAGDGE